MGACPSAAAHMRGVCSRAPILTSAAAPAAISNLTTSGLPVRAARRRAVSPVERATFGPAFARSSFSIIAALPFVAASISGVTPNSLAASTSAPA